MLLIHIQKTLDSVSVYNPEEKHNIKLTSEEYLSHILQILELTLMM